MKNEAHLEDRRDDRRRPDRTASLLDDLERRMHSHFAKPAFEDPLLNSQDDELDPRPEQTTKGKNTFKLFTKPTAQPMSVQELEKPTPAKESASLSRKEPANIAKSHMGQLIEEVEAIEILVRKKLALKEERVAQLEREISIETEEKVHLYRTNCQLEQELQELIKSRRSEQEKRASEEKMLEEELRRLNKVYEERRNEAKKLKKEEELLRETLKHSHHHRKGCLESELRNKSRSRDRLRKNEKTHHQEEEQYLRGLVVELDRLKNMVKQKMKKERSRLKIR